MVQAPARTGCAEALAHAAADFAGGDNAVVPDLSPLTSLMTGIPSSLAKKIGEPAALAVNALLSRKDHNRQSRPDG